MTGDPLADNRWHPLDIMVCHGDRPPSAPTSPHPYTARIARKCPTCRGTGINPVWPTKVCPKCNGERTIGA